MNCDDVLPRLGPWIDGEVDPTEHEAIERHLTECTACAAEAKSLRALDHSLETLLAADAGAAERVAEGVVRELAAETVVPAAPRHEPRHEPRRELLTVVLAMSIGFVLAVLVFQPWRSRERVRIVERPPEGSPADVPPETAMEAGVARFVLATGPVAVRNGAEGAWSAVEDVASFTCPTDATVRTEPGTRAELRTADGAVIRLNDETELQFKSARRVELGCGQIWCRSPSEAPLEVVTRQTAPWQGTCAPGTSLWTALGDEGVRVTTAEGEVSVHTDAGEHRVGSGESVVVRGGKVVSNGDEDPILATRWIHPFLVRKGADDPELKARIDAYLARIGGAKASFLFEQEVRSLGEAAALPLLRYVQSPISREEVDRRRRAARILADVAPARMVGELIDLLADDDPDVRFEAARSLARLTDETQGHPPAEWRRSPGENAAPLAEWRTWWTTHRERYPTP